MELNELVTGTPIKLQVRLTEESTPEQIRAALDHSLNEMSKNMATATKIRHVVGTLLYEVKSKKLYDESSFDDFLKTNVEERHGIGVQTAWDAIRAVEYLHITPDQAGKIRVTNLNLVSKAVKQASPENRPKLEKILLQKAEKMPIRKFAEYVDRAGLIRKGVGAERMAQVSFQVSQSTLKTWLRIVGDRKQSEVFAELVREYGGRRERAA